jgi:WhiB family redox-sensing transcriptional regulator
MAYGETLAQPVVETRAEKKQRMIPHLRDALKRRQFLRDDAWRIMTQAELPDTSGDWSDNASCKDEDPELFFPGKGHTPNQAREICLGCAARDACLVDAMANGDYHAVLGGLTERERKSLRRRLVLFTQIREQAEADQ